MNLLILTSYYTLSQRSCFCMQANYYGKIFVPAALTSSVLDIIDDPQIQVNLEFKFKYKFALHFQITAKKKDNIY